MDENRTGNQLEFAEADDVLAGNSAAAAAAGLSSTLKQGGPRKSMGRRVSFAATAKVRLFEKGAADGNTVKAPAASEDDDDAMQIDNAPASPVRTPGTPTSKLPKVLSPNSAASSASNSNNNNNNNHDQSMLPSRIPVRSPLTKSPAMMRSLRSPKSPASSFEIDLNAGKADDTNSIMSSFDDQDGSSLMIAPNGTGNNINNNNNGNNDTMNQNNNNNNHNNDDTMDFTTCVGGIAPAAAFQRLSEANTMDFTGCVGKILSDLNDNKYDELENDTMDLTTCIGGLLEDTHSNNTNNDTSSHNDNENTNREGDTMDLTRVLPNTIVMESPVHPAVAALKLTSPSPFLVHSPLTTPRRRQQQQSHASNNNNSNSQTPSKDVEFIDAVGRPDILNAMPASPMVMDTHNKAHVKKSVTIMADLSPKREAVDDLFQSLIETDPVVHNGSSSNNINNGKATSQSSQPTNNTTTNQPSTANNNAVKELLAKAGIRFMDNLTSLGRRETTGRPRESDVITPARHRFLLNVVGPEGQAVEERCREMVDYITICRQDIGRLEGQFLQSQAALTITTNFGDNNTDDDAVNKMKTAKSVARLAARQQWYHWRAQKEAPLNHQLNKNLNTLKQDLAVVTMKETDIDAVGVPLVRLRDRLAGQLAAAEAEERARASVDWEAVSQLQAQCQELTQMSSQLDLEMAQLAQHEEDLRQRLVQVQEDRRLVQRGVESLESERQQLCECSDLALRELKSKMALLQALHGWHLIAVKPNHLIIQWQRHQAIVQARIQLESGAEGLVTVPAVQLMCLEGGGGGGGTRGHGIVKHAPSVVKVEAGRGLLKTIISLLSQLDRLHHIDRAISKCIKAQLAVDPEEPVISATVFKAETKSKWSVKVKVLADRLDLLSVDCEYGGAPDMAFFKDALDAANLGSRFAQLETLVDYLCQ